MICLSGILAKELKAQGKLSEKFEDLAMEPIIPNWYNRAYNAGTLVEGANAPLGRTYLFVPSTEKLPFTLDEDIQFTVKFMPNASSNVFSIFAQTEDSTLYDGIQYTSSYGIAARKGSDSSTVVKKLSYSCGSDPLWFRLNYSIETAAWTAHYSKDGNTYTSFYSFPSRDSDTHSLVVYTEKFTNSLQNVEVIKGSTKIFDGSVL